MTFYGFVYHICLGRWTEHLFYGKIERTYTVRLLESKAVVACRFSDYVHRGTFTFCNLAHMFDSFFFDKKSHTFLAFIGDDFFGRQRFVTDRQLAHVDQTAAFFHQFRQTVDVTCRTMVMNRNNRIHIFFTKGTDYVVGTFLHFCIRTLHGVQLDTTTVTTGIYWRYGTAAKSDSVVVTTDNDYFVSGFRCAFQTVALCTVAYTSGKHDNFVIAVNLIVLCMFESQYRTADQWLAELVSEIGSAIGRLNQNLFRSLVQPFAYRKDFFPFAAFVCAWVRSHVDSSTCNRPWTFTTTHTVTNFTACTGRSTVERLYGCREIVSFRF